MSATSPRYARWKAPAEDGQALIWPEPDQILADARDNHRLFAGASSCLLQNIPLVEMRERFRRAIGHVDDRRPIFATGHQTELHHPGVWAKNVLIDAAARRFEGRAIHFAVDTDEPKHLLLRWPGGSISIAGDRQANLPWSGLLPAPTPEQLTIASQTFAGAAQQWNFRPLVDEFFKSMIRLAASPGPLPAVLSGAIQEVDGSLGLQYEPKLVWPMWGSEPYLVFVHHILARAEAFAADYNAALEEFRREKRIRTPARPMPDLKTADQEIEVPFWLDDLRRGRRTRSQVVRHENGFAIEADEGDRFIFDPAADGWRGAEQLRLWLDRRGLRLSPRALTLTAVLRLLIADQFVHGIGGGEYDQVLDKLIARHWKISPPRFAVTTATLYFPTAAELPRACLPCLALEGHRLKHGILGEEKAQLVRAIEASPRRSAQRADLFASMHEQLRAAAGHPTIRQWEERLAQARAQAREQRILFDRELFYALQPADRLAAMIDDYRKRMIA